MIFKNLLNRTNNGGSLLFFCRSLKYCELLFSRKIFSKGSVVFPNSSSRIAMEYSHFDLVFW